MKETLLNAYVIVTAFLMGAVLAVVLSQRAIIVQPWSITITPNLSKNPVSYDNLNAIQKPH